MLTIIHLRMRDGRRGIERQMTLDDLLTLQLSSDVRPQKRSRFIIFILLCVIFPPWSTSLYNFLCTHDHVICGRAAGCTLWVCELNSHCAPHGDWSTGRFLDSWHVGTNFSILGIRSKRLLKNRRNTMSQFRGDKCVIVVIFFVIFHIIQFEKIY